MAFTIHAVRDENGFFLSNAQAKNKGDKKQEQTRNSLFAGDMVLKADSIAIKRKQAQKQALKVVGDVFDTDRELDEAMKGIEDRMKELQSASLDYYHELEEIGGIRAQMEEGYGVSRDSREYADLELLRKERDASYPWSDTELTDEEKEEIERIKSEGITDYQRDMLTLDNREETCRTHIEKNRLSLELASKSYTSYKLERLKSNPMAKAKDEYEEMMKAAGEEILGDLMAEGREHVDEKTEEIQEEMEERAEEEQIEEEKEAEKKEKEALMEALIEGAGENDRQEILLKNAASDSASEDVNLMELYSRKPSTEQKLKQILDKLKLLEEDLKGAVINTGL